MNGGLWTGSSCFNSQLTCLSVVYLMFLMIINVNLSRLLTLNSSISSFNAIRDAPKKTFKKSIKDDRRVAFSSFKRG